MAENSFEFSTKVYRKSSEEFTASLIRHADSTPNTSICLKSIFLSVSSVGVSVLVYPLSIAKSGFPIWAFLFIFALTINYTASYLLIRVANKESIGSFSEICTQVFGKWKWVTDFLKSGVEVGAIVSCFLFFNEFWMQFEELTIFGPWSVFSLKLNKLATPTLLTNLFMFFILKKHSLRDFEIISLAAAFVIFCFSFFAFFKMYFHVSRFSQLMFFNFQSVPETFAVLLLGFMNQDQIIDLFENKKINKERSMIQALNIQTCLLSLMYAIISISGSLLSDNNMSHFRNSPSPDSWNTHLFVKIVNLFLGVFVLYANSKILCSVKSKLNAILIQQDYYSGYWNDNLAIAIVQLSVTAITILLAINEVKFESVLEILSKYVSSILCLVIPVFAYVKVFKPRVLFGVLIFFIFMCLLVLMNLNLLIET